MISNVISFTARVMRSNQNSSSLLNERYGYCYYYSSSMNKCVSSIVIQPRRYFMEIKSEWFGINVIASFTQNKWKYWIQKRRFFDVKKERSTAMSRSGFFWKICCCIQIFVQKFGHDLNFWYKKRDERWIPGSKDMTISICTIVWEKGVL